jgi:hypothetical protein
VAFMKIISTRVIVQDGERWIQTADLFAFIRGKPNTPPQGVQSISADPSKFSFCLTAESEQSLGPKYINGVSLGRRLCQEPG